MADHADHADQAESLAEQSAEQSADQGHAAAAKGPADLASAASGAEPAAKKPKIAASAALTADMNVGEAWATALSSEFAKPYFSKLQAFVASQRAKGKVFPLAPDVFSWTRLCTPAQVSVVILGQDPYHDDGQAHGLSFSVKAGVRPPPSLVNMFKELASDIAGFKVPTHGYLGGWATQGVLLLNAVLTVRAHEPKSHANQGWEQFTDAVIAHVNTQAKPCVFLLWGADAQKKGKKINTSKHLVLNAVHPSPLSAHKGFFGCKHFSKANAFLASKGRTAIEWGRLPATL